jgi:hypothetical protein
MSVTFSVYAGGKFVTPEGWTAKYEEDPDYGRIQTNQNPLEMNVANGNYRRIMNLLGLDCGECCGTWGDGSLQHVADALRIALDGLQGVPGLDGGIPSEESRGKGGCLMVDCGVRVGYFGERLGTLLEIVTKAIEVGGVVVFG